MPVLVHSVQGLYGGLAQQCFQLPLLIYTRNTEFQFNQDRDLKVALSDAPKLTPTSTNHLARNISSVLTSSSPRNSKKKKKKPQKKQKGLLPSLLYQVKKK